MKKWIDDFFNDTGRVNNALIVMLIINLIAQVVFGILNLIS